MYTLTLDHTSHADGGTDPGSPNKHSSTRSQAKQPAQEGPGERRRTDTARPPQRQKVYVVVIRPKTRIQDHSVPSHPGLARQGDDPGGGHVDHAYSPCRRTRRPLSKRATLRSEPAQGRMHGACTDRHVTGQAPRPDRSAKTIPTD